LSIHKIFGSFSSNFLGITLSFDNVDQFKYFDAMYENKGVVPKRPKSINELDAIFIGTTFEHETRHWHDFLLCPLSIGIFRMRISGILNSYSLFQNLMRNREFEILPTPLTEWVSKSETERKLQTDFARHWSEFKEGRVWQPNQVNFDSEYKLGNPIFHERAATSEEIEVLLRLLVRNHEFVKNGRIGVVDSETILSFTPRTVFELSALNVQLMSVWHTFGEYEHTKFLNHLARDQLSSINRAFVFAMAISACRSGREITTLMADIKKGEHALKPAPNDAAFRLGVALTWSLMGDRTIDGDKGCPAFRLTHLLGAMLEGVGAVFVEGLDAQAYFDAWNEHFGTSSHSVIAAGVDKRLGKAIQKLDAIANRFEVAKTAKSCLEGVYDARKHFNAIFELDPTFYASPAFYERNIIKWPGCPVHMDLRKTGSGIGPIDKVNDEGVIFDTLIQNDNGTQFAQEFFRSKFFAESSIKLEDSQELRSLFLLHDLLLEPDNLESLDSRSMKQILFEEHGKKILRLI